MKVKKGSQQLRKGSRINRKRLRTLFFPYNFSVKPLRFPFGVQRLSLYTTRREAPSFIWTRLIIATVDYLKLKSLLPK